AAVPSGPFYGLQRVKLNFSLCVRREQRTSGTGRGGFPLLDLVDERPHLASELVRDLARLSLGVEVEEGLVGVRQHLRPAALFEDLDPVGQVDFAAREALV